MLFECEDNVPLLPPDLSVRENLINYVIKNKLRPLLSVNTLPGA